MIHLTPGQEFLAWILLFTVVILVCVFSDWRDRKRHKRSEWLRMFDEREP